MARNHCIDEILQPVVVPYISHYRVFAYIQTMEPGALLQDDNDRPHRARIVDAYLQQQHITRIDWPARSQDLNPIEHVWDQLGRAVQARMNVNSTRADLRRFLVDELDRLPAGQCAAFGTQHAPEMYSLHCCTWWPYPLLM